jgi:hypothetical protein
MTSPVAQGTVNAPTDTTTAPVASLGSFSTSWNRFVEIVSSNTISFNQNHFTINAEDSTIAKIAKVVVGIIPTIITSAFSLLIATTTGISNLVKSALCSVKEQAPQQTAAAQPEVAKA